MPAASAFIRSPRLGSSCEQIAQMHVSDRFVVMAQCVPGRASFDWRSALTSLRSVPDDMSSRLRSFVGFQRRKPPANALALSPARHSGGNS